MIRPALMQAVLEALESHMYFSREDFRISEYEGREKDPCLRIEYRYDSAFQFRFHIPKAKKKLGDSWERYYFNCTMSPGRESVEETLNADERTGLISELKDWLNRLHEDVVSAPVVRQFAAHASAIDQLRERLDALPEEPLSRADVAEFREGLDRLKSELTEQLKHAVEDKQELKRRVEELTHDIDLLKKTLESMTKRQWGELFLVRMNKWKERLNLRQLAAGTRVLKALMPGGIGEHLETAADVADQIADVIDGQSKPEGAG